MRKKLTTRTARKMNAARKTHGGGRPKVPTRCPRCQTPCPSRIQALAHCL
jgi:hypothetical protein